MAEKYATEVAQDINVLHAEIKIDIERHYFRPHGGMAGLLHAPRLEDILRGAEPAGGKFGAACGELLCYIVMIDQHHPDLQPSLGLAMEIMEHSAKAEGRTIPADRPRKEMWQTWRGIAPYWGRKAQPRKTAR
jgi:hypothetical protein